MTEPIAPARWAELEPLLDAALERPPAERAAFAAQITGGDVELLAELAVLLRDASRVTAMPLLDQTAGGVFASLLREDAESIAHTLQASLQGRYTILRQLGAGGMATVYLAHEVAGDRNVALKVLHPDLSHTVGAERFAREVQLAATLDHPNIVGAFDSGDAGGSLWFTMPFIDGESLRDRMTRVGQLPLEEALAVFCAAAEALGFAHARGVMHRDIKPDNILLAGGQTYVADFGIARALQSTGDTLTMTGMAVGTPAYMAPEQAAGEKQLTERVDIYALGAVLYEMLAGVTAFTGATAQAIIVRAMTSDPQPIHPIRTAVTPALDAVILKAMSRTTADRFATMAEFRDAVVAAAKDHTAMHALPPKPARRSPIALVSAVAAVALIVVVALLWSGVGASPPRLAVLVFEDRSSDTTDAYLSEGFTEEIGSRIALIPQLSVVSNTAVRRAKIGAAAGVSEIGGALGATHLLSGSVQRSAGRLRVTAELVRVSDGEQEWSESFNRAESELPLLLHDIAVTVATRILGSLDANARVLLAAPTENSAAYDQYLRGSRTRLDEGAAGLGQSVAAFEAALALDPRFAAAQARLAGVYARSLMWNVSLPGLPPDTVLAHAASAAARALALDSASADAWAGRGTVMFLGASPNYPEAAASLGRAAALDSTNAGVSWMYGQVLRRLGDFAGAERASRAALRADPTFAQAYNQMAQLAYSTRRLTNARAANDSAIALVPTNWQYWELRARISMALRDTARAKQEAEHAVNLSPPEQQPYPEFVLAQAVELSGDSGSARRRVAARLA